ncbi:MAG: hypothetical protein EBU82_00435 [Flavobacteriia bacterium]|nr:hypothetical protein [Flavobacteriia bacterium]
MAQTRKIYPRSLPYNASKGCPSGYHKRMTYKSSSGRVVPSRCVKATTVYANTSKEFKRGVTQKAARRLKSHGMTNTTVNVRKACPPGKILRKAYVRRFRTNIRERGYTVKRGSQVYKAYPRATSTVVQAACIKDKGLPGKGPQEIAPLRKGELMKHGYSYRKSDLDRHEALRKAAKEFGALGIYRKLDAVAKLSVRAAPRASAIFKKDRNWVKRRLGPLKAF